MALGGVYETGTITIAAGGHNVTGVGTLWGPVAEVGDWILCNGQVGMVGAVADDTHLTLESAWQGTLPTAAAYVLIKMSWLRYDPALTHRTAGSGARPGRAMGAANEHESLASLVQDRWRVG
jgi:hypothetical protein